MTAPPLRPDVAALGGLPGTWSGRGHGSYPTIEALDFEETVTFAHVGKPFLSYSQRTKHAVGGHSTARSTTSSGRWPRLTPPPARP